MENMLDIIDKIINKNFPNSLNKNIYLYNELFISIFLNGEFCLYGIYLKSDKILVNKYSGDNTKIGKLLLIIIKKYEKLFILLLKSSKINLVNIGDESDFINIYDLKQLSFFDVKNKLEFSFLDDYLYRRRGDMEFRIEDESVLDIYHSDFECSRCSGPNESFNSFQDYYKDIFDEKYFVDNLKCKKLDISTNITSYESIAIGGNEKINNILSNKELVDNYDVISINKTCISVIMGDDVNSLLKCNNISDNKVIYVDQNIDSGHRAIINFLKKIDISKDASSIDEILFFGLKKNKNTFELINFLKDNFGIIVGNVLIPNINKKDLEKILSYKLSIFFTGKDIKAQKIFKLYPINQLDFSIPYGITKVKELIENIFSKLSRELNKDILYEILEGYKIKNFLLFEKAKNFKIGFIVYDFHIKQFLDDNFRGVPIISMLNDMGFQLNFFITTTSNIYLKDIEKFNRKNYFDNEYNFSTIVSDKKGDLFDFINSEINCFYSEVASDYRILDKGKEQFSVGDLEYGIEGFYRSFERLIRKCEKQFYKNEILKLN